jgi:hypothetical protein
VRQNTIPQAGSVCTGGEGQGLPGAVEGTRLMA